MLPVVEYARLARIRVVSVRVEAGLRRTVVEPEQGCQVRRGVQENSRFHCGHENGLSGPVLLDAVAGMPLLQLFELWVQGPGKVSRVSVAWVLIPVIPVIPVILAVLAVSATVVIAVTATAATVVLMVVVVDDRERRRRRAIVSAAAVGTAVVLPHADSFFSRSVNNRKLRRDVLPAVNRRGDDGDDDDDDDDTWQTRRPSGRTALNLLVGDDDADDSCACDRVRVCVCTTRRGCATWAKGFRARGLRTRSPLTTHARGSVARRGVRGEIIIIIKHIFLKTNAVQLYNDRLRYMTRPILYRATPKPLDRWSHQSSVAKVTKRKWNEKTKNWWKRYR